MDSNFASFFSPMLEIDNPQTKGLLNEPQSSFVDSILSQGSSPMMNGVSQHSLPSAANGAAPQQQQQMMAMMMNFFLTQMQGIQPNTNNAAPSAASIPAALPSSIMPSDVNKGALTNSSSMAELELDGNVSPFSSDSFSSDEYSSPSSPQSMHFNANAMPAVDYRSTTNPSLFSAINPPTNNIIINNNNNTQSTPSAQCAVEIIAPPSLHQAVIDSKKGKRRSSPTPSSNSANTAVKEESSSSSYTIDNISDKSVKSSNSKKVNTKSSKRGQKRSAVESDSDSDSCNDSDDDHTSSTSSPRSSLPPSLQDLLTEVDEKKRRLARKAELARMSRRRKKMRLHDLEKEVDRLNKELAALKKQAKGIELEKAHGVTASAWTVNDEETEFKKLMSLMNEFVAAAKSDSSSTSSNIPNPSSVAGALLDNFVASHTQFVNGGQHHLNALSFHVTPILPFEFLNWMCTQNEKFYEESAGLWKALLVDELKLNADQMTDMDTLRHTIRKQFKHVAEIEKQFKRLNDAMTKQNIFTIQNMERIRTVLTPAQFAQYIDWVQKFGAICLKISV